MKKRLTIVLLALALFVCAFALSVSAKSVYLEEIPDELKAPSDTATHFVVLEDEVYFVGSGGTVNGLNTDKITADLQTAGIDTSKIGTEYLTKLIIPSTFGGSTVTAVGFNGAFKENTYFWNKVGYIRMPGTVASVTDMNQATQKLRYFDFGENSQVTAIPYCFMNSSKQMMLIENFPRNLNSIGEQAFNLCYGAFRGELYLNATTIGVSAFNNSLSFVTKLILGPNTQNIGRQSLCVRSSEIPDSYEPADGKVSITEIVFECDVSKVTFATQGNDTGSFYFTGNTRSPYEKLETIVLAHPDNERAYVDGAVFNDFTADGVTVLFNDSDGLDDYVTVYHSFDTIKGVSYESFLSEGTKSIECSKCGAITTEKTAPVFEFLGYSYKIDAINGGGLACGYKVDKEALEEFKSYNEGTISFGLIMFNPNSDSAKNATAIFANGKLTINEKALQVEITDVKYSTINVLINGFDEQSADLELVIAFYLNIAVGEGDSVVHTTTIEQGTTTKDGTSVVKGYYEKDVKLATITYNTVAQ
ncbi:MAG: hypothetical protein IJW10_06755 [Clostridia bacterium]|nr:hypothetical protein [Clostridia bacterium]